MPPSRVIKEGMLSKKSPKGFKGFRAWQKRWFVVDNKYITYYEIQVEGQRPGQEHTKGVIPLLEIEAIEYLPTKRVGCRFDVRVKESKVYCLHGSTPDDSHEWIAAMQYACKEARSEKEEAKKESILESTGRRYSQLQHLFFEAKFTAEAMWKTKGKEQEEKFIIKQINRDYPTDHHVLLYLLQHILNPELGIFNYNQSLDVFDEEEEDIDGGATMKQGKEVFALTPRTKITKMLKHLSAKLQTNLDELAGQFAADMFVTIQDLQEFAEWHKTVTAPTRVIDHIQELLHDLAVRQASAVTGTEAQGPTGGGGSAKADKMRVAEMLRSKELKRTLGFIFKTKDTRSHGLALRLFWTIFRAVYHQKKAVAEFTSTVAVHCCADVYNEDIKATLLDILLSLPGDVPVKLTNVETISFYMPVKMPSTWQPIFFALQSSDMQLRQKTLADVNALLHDNQANCESLSRSGPWQDWIYPLFTDMDKARKTEDPVKTCYAFAINALTLVHYSYFTTSFEFAGLLESTISRLHMYGGANSECQALCATIIGALVNKLTSQKLKFKQSDVHMAIEWRNIKKICDVVRQFVFQSAWWQTNSDPNFKSGASSIIHEAEEEELPAYPQQQMNNRNAAKSLVRATTKAKLGEQEGAFILYKRRPGRFERRWFNDAPLITDHGIHWTPQGGSADAELVKKILGLFRALRIDTFAASQLGEDFSKDELDFRKRLKAEFYFWEEALEYITMLPREHISERRQLTYRRFAYLTQSFLAATHSKRGRRLVKKQLTSIMAGRGDKVELSDDDIADLDDEDEEAPTGSAGMGGGAMAGPDDLDDDSDDDYAAHIIADDQKMNFFLRKVESSSGKTGLMRFATVFEAGGYGTYGTLVKGEWAKELNLPRSVIVLVQGGVNRSENAKNKLKIAKLMGEDGPRKPKPKATDANLPAPPGVDESLEELGYGNLPPPPGVSGGFDSDDDDLPDEPDDDELPSLPGENGNANAFTLPGTFSLPDAGTFSLPPAPASGGFTLPPPPSAAGGFVLPSPGADFVSPAVPPDATDFAPPSDDDSSGPDEPPEDDDFDDMELPDMPDDELPEMPGDEADFSLPPPPGGW